MTPILPVALLALLAQLRTGESLRTGAPSLACISLRPFHGLHRARPASASQFFLSQSSLTYAPGQNVSVDIVTHSSERYFRGFIVQAYDPTTGAQIGRFLPNSEARPIESCSAATHRNNLNKKHVTITWLPPAFGSSLVGLDSLTGDQSASSQWLGIRPPSERHSSSSSGGIQPVLNVSMNRRRQLQAGQPQNVTSTGGGQPANHSVPQRRPDNGLRQVRFRATIVVTYEEFYIGFESSEQSFDKFDYATNQTSQAVPASLASHQ